MPILPPVTASPYDDVYTILNSAKTRLNDALPTLFPVGGKILESTQTQTQQMVNTAWRKFQEFLGNMGYSRNNQEQIIYQCPVVASQDPAAQCYINWFGFFDGANFYQAPVLPSNLIIPRRVWERQSGTNAGFADMALVPDGIPTWNKQARNCFWEWRGDAIYMPGSQQTMDLRVRYASYLPDFTDVGSTPWFQQSVQIMRCQDALSNYICAEVVAARSDVPENPFTAAGEQAAKLIMNRDIATKQRINIRRQPRSGRGGGSGYSGGLWC